MKRIKLLVVDDSILFREVLARYIRQDEMIDVVGTAGDAYSARDMILKHEPDVMTLDVEMPRMDGIAFLKKLLPQYYIPTIIVSGSEEKRKAALLTGAVEVIAKPAARTTKDMAQFASELCASIKRAYTKRNPDAEPKKEIITPIRSAASVISNRKITPITAPAASGKKRRADALIALGASTGGTEALEQVVKAFPADSPPVLIVQHMPAGFTKLYADRLNRSCKWRSRKPRTATGCARG